ncbi:MAG: hypothetical protein AAF328_05630, partial [Planctomycetota bacterium]
PPAGAVLAATQRAPKYSAMIAGLDDVLVDYYVEAIDAWGNVTGPTSSTCTSGRPPPEAAAAILPGAESW